LVEKATKNDVNNYVETIETVLSILSKSISQSKEN